MIKTGGFDAVCFTSSSTVRNLVGIAGKPHARTIVSVIGPQTATEFGLRVDVQGDRLRWTARSTLWPRTRPGCVPRGFAAPAQDQARPPLDALHREGHLPSSLGRCPSRVVGVGLAGRTRVPRVGA
jgi:hypothetical protein